MLLSLFLGVNMKFNSFIKKVNANQEIEVFTNKEYLYDKFNGKAIDFIHEYTDRDIDLIKCHNNKLLIILRNI